MRQRYCTKADKQNEQIVMERLAKFFDVSFELTTGETPYDGRLMFGSKVLAFVEVKRRHFKWGDYPDVNIDKHKVDRMLDAAKPHRAMCVFAILTDDDQVWWCELTPKVYTDAVPKDGLRTRNVRDEWDGKEIGFGLPAEWFRRV
jgi:hypothetical protein